MLVFRRFCLVREKCYSFATRLSFITTKRRSSSNLKYEEKFTGPGLQYFIAKSQPATKLAEPPPEEKIPFLTEEDMNGYGRKVYFDVLGCQMNHNDAEIVWSLLKSRGYSKTDDFMKSDVYLIFTCAIRDSAERKIWDKVKLLNQLKKNNTNIKWRIGILGCTAERLKEKILEKHQNVDLVAGPDSYKDLPRMLALVNHDMKSVNVILSLDETYADVRPVRLNENAKTAYVSIMRGCDNMCSYCIVPFTRGKERSRPMSSILDEVQKLSDLGIKEITLLGQNVNSYRDMTSLDYYNISPQEVVCSPNFKTVYKPKIGGVRFDVLLDKVSLINPEMRIRFTSPHPKDFPDEVLQLIRERKNICNSIHLPAQSGSSKVLENMRRGYTREAYLDLVDRIRNILPDVGLTTDIMCGFCGETQEDHDLTLDLIKRVRYNFVYMYPYSMREKTTAYHRLEDNVPLEVKRRRATEINELFRKIADEIHKSEIGQNQLILVEGKSKKSDDFWFGRNEHNVKVIIPDINIPISATSDEKNEIKPGDYIYVNIKSATCQVLKGDPLYHTSLADFNPSDLLR